MSCLLDVMFIQLFLLILTYVSFFYPKYFFLFLIRSCVHIVLPLHISHQEGNGRVAHVKFIKHLPLSVGNYNVLELVMFVDLMPR